MGIKKISLLALTSMIVVSIDNVRNLPSIAIYGDQIFELYLILGFCFFIPCGLATMMFALSYPNAQGGVYDWVAKAFGYRVGFIAIWLQWIENVVWFPSIVSFIVAALAYIIGFSVSPLNLTILVPLVFWICTWLNLKGIALTAKISEICTLFGLLLPMVVLIAFAGYWLQTDNPVYNQHVFSGLFHFHGFRQLDYSAIGMMALSLAGIEITAVHILNIHQPQRTYPLAIIVAMIIIVSTLILGSLSILVLIPVKEINFVDSILQIFNHFLMHFKLQAFEPVCALFIMLGSLGGLTNWIIAPIRGLLVSANDGFLPSSLRKVNDQLMPSHLLVIQAIIVTILSFSFLVFDTVNQSYWLLTIVPAGLYLMMYALMFAAYLKLYLKKALHQFQWSILNHLFALINLIGLVFCLFACTTILMPPELVFGSMMKQTYVIGILTTVLLAFTPAFIFIYYHANTRS